MNQQHKAYAYGLAAVLCWSTVATAFKLSLARLDPFQLLFYSCLFSLLVLLSVLALTRSLHKLHEFRRKEWFQSALYGALNPFLYYTILFKAYDLLPAQEAQPINYTWAIMLSLLSVPLLRQKLHKKDLIALCLSYFGVLLICTHGRLTDFTFQSPLGVFLALLSTVIWAVYWIVCTKDSRDPVAGLTANFLFGTVYTFVSVCIFSSPRLPQLADSLGPLYVGIFEMGLTFVLWLKAMRLTSSTARISTLIFLSPFLSLFFISAFVGENILPATWLGLFFITLGIAFQQVTGKS
ncbi:DMT family transporter [Desulfobaculum bizertense]|uniref:Permease of the drug/metabolite transporter (DMT) superfamily n=1 Tax=Desulfobaculum bizertense DSM 18034 TaxID=1121442 RepID=A0A1T4WVN9_9BACT|nr:DMT family transporter [Desulfobaculum bizertense]SKA81374.1 Permease of the drug/metabolite transporter (DMT) superfamily [Desulfobaculum bizertense DSM 18034]